MLKTIMKTILNSLKKAVKWYCYTTAQVYNYGHNGELFS